MTNKIFDKNGDILVDLSQDTVTPETLAFGKKAYDKNGNLITGTNTEIFGLHEDTTEFDGFVENIETINEETSINNMLVEGEGTYYLPTGIAYTNNFSAPNITCFDAKMTFSMMDGRYDTMKFYLPKCTVIKHLDLYSDDDIPTTINIKNGKYIHNMLSSLGANQTDYTIDADSIKYIGSNCLNRYTLIKSEAFTNCYYIGDNSLENASIIGKKRLKFSVSTRIGSNAFQNVNLLNIDSPENIRYIGNGALNARFFSDLPLRASYIGDDAYYLDCGWIGTVLLNCSYLGNCYSNKLLSMSFNNLLGKNLYINACTHIGSYRFYSLKSIMSATFNANVRYIGSGAFQSTKGGPNEVVFTSFPAPFNFFYNTNYSLSYIGSRAFKDSEFSVNSNITKLDLPNIQIIEEETFMDAPWLEGLNVSLDNCTLIRSNAFNGTNISGISAPYCSKIESYAFSGTDVGNDNSIYLPNCTVVEGGGLRGNITTGTGKLVLPNCSYIAPLGLPTGLNELYLPKISEIDYAADGSTLYGTFSQGNFNTLLIGIKSNTVTPYQYITNGIAYTYLDTVKTLYLPEYNSAFTRANLISSTATKYSVVDGLKSLQKLYIPKAKAIGASVFQQHASIMEVYAEAATVVNSYAFSGAGKLSFVKLDNVDQLWSAAFYNCTSLSAINLSKCTYMNNNVFANCTNLKRINLPMCTYIDTSGVTPNFLPFFNCTALESVRMDALYAAPSYLFSGLGSLKYFSALELGRITSGMFSSCSRLEFVEAPNITAIDSSAFSGAFKTTVIDKNIYLAFPKLTTIFENAFRSTYSKEYAYTFLFAPALNLIKSSAFYQGFQYLDILGDKGQLAIYSSAFSSCGLTLNNFSITAMYSGCFKSAGQANFTNCNFENLAYFPSSCFYSCTDVTGVFSKLYNKELTNFKQCSYIYNYAFYTNAIDKTIIKLGSASTVGIGTNVFYPSTKNYILVPSSLYTKYTGNTNWAAYVTSGLISIYSF